jgi:hypothetical protein
MEAQPMHPLVGLATIFVMIGLPCLTLAYIKTLKYKYGAQPKDTGQPEDGFTLPEDPDDPPPPPTTPTPQERWASGPSPWPSAAQQHVERHNLHMVAVKS